MSLSKTDLVYRLFAFTRSKVEGLDQETSDAVVAEVDRFNSGMKTRTKTDDLENLVNQVAAAIGLEEAEARVALRKAVDEITRTDAAPIHGEPIDYPKQFGKQACRVWLAERDLKTTTKTKVAELQDMIVTYKAETWDDEPDHELAAKRQAEIDAAAAKRERKEREEAARANASAAPSPSSKAAPSKALTITEDVAIQVVSKGTTYTGVIHPDATVTFDDTESNGAIRGKTYKSTSKAACAAMDSKAANGWLRITFMDGETRRPIDALRENSKGYSLSGGGRRKKVMGPEEAANEVTRLEARVRRLSDSLEKAKANLAAAKEAAEAQPQVPADDPGGEPETPVAEEPVAEAIASTDPEQLADREQELRAMKAKDLRAIAATLKIQGRSKLKVADLVVAIVAAEAA